MLNNSQQKAKKALSSFLLNPNQREFVLRAPAGYGKSYLLDDLFGSLGSINDKASLLGGTAIRQCYSTATTNKAAAVLNNGKTLASTLGLRLITDYKNGGQSIQKTSKSQRIDSALVSVDECSMVDQVLRGHADDLLAKSKIIYVGDDCQLLNPSADGFSVFTENLPSATLDEPMRQDANSDLFKLCTQLRETVKTGVWKPIEEGNGIRHTNPQEIVPILNDWFHADMGVDEARCITFTNEKAKALNGFIRPMCGYTEEWAVGDVISCRNVCYDVTGSETTFIEQTAVILDIDPTIATEHSVDYQYVTLGNNRRYKVPVDTMLYNAALKHYAGRKDWHSFYSLKENFLDMRSAYAGTSHTSQGSTYDRVYIDLSDMGRCFHIPTLARAMYVAVSRAKTEVVFNGALPKQLRG